MDARQIERRRCAGHAPAISRQHHSMSNCDRVRLILEVVVLTVLTVLTVSAQDRPNFVGEWIRLEPSTDPCSVLTVQNEQTIRIEARSPGPSSGTYEVG